MKPKRVLLTGASGLVGSHVLKYLLDNTDWTFVCPCSFRHKGNPLRIKTNGRVEVLTLDLTGAIPDLGNFDYILNLASDSHVDRSIADPVPFVENNISMVLQMLEYARRNKPELFIQFSTDEVFGHTEEISDVLWPSNPYAASKASQELLVSAYRKTYGIQAVVTNSNNVIGEGQDPEKFVAKLVQQINKGETVTIHAQNGVLGRRRYNPVENVGAGLLFLIENYKPVPQDARTPRYGLTGGEELDNLQMAQLVAKVMGKELKYEIVEVTTIRPGYDQRYPKVNTALEDMGFSPPLTLEQGLSWIK
jgi:dTDP-glucose 4,6-dehydratase